MILFRNKDCEGEMKKLEKICRDQREEINLKNQEISHLKTETGMKSEYVITISQILKGLID